MIISIADLCIRFLEGMLGWAIQMSVSYNVILISYNYTVRYNLDTVICFYFIVEIFSYTCTCIKITELITSYIAS